MALEVFGGGGGGGGGGVQTQAQGLNRNPAAAHQNCMGWEVGETMAKVKPNKACQKLSRSLFKYTF